MTSALGIASVSVVLVDLLNDGLINHDVGSMIGGDVAVSALPPDRVLPESGGSETSRLNLFLYSVTPNPGWRNAGLPARDGSGTRIGSPPLALDLHYLLSAYGERDFHSEILLGYAMQHLHERPVLAREDVRRALAPPSPTAGSALPVALRDLSTSGLADQVELIKITPEPMPTEEMSRLWAAFQSHYRSTAAYRVSVVLIESELPVPRALPVRNRFVRAQPAQRPFVDSVMSADGVGEPILAGTTVTVRGRDLRGDLTSVRIGDADVTPPVGDVSPTEVRASLAGVPLRAGAQGLRIVHRLLLGVPPIPHAGAESNLAAFVVRPAVASAIDKQLTETGGRHSGTLGLDVAPAVGPGQRVVVRLDEQLPPDAPLDAAPRTLTLRAPVEQEERTRIAVPLAGLAPGSFLVRVQVDGAESPLAIDPATDRYDAPKVVIP